MRRAAWLTGAALLLGCDGGVEPTLSNVTASSGRGTLGMESFLRGTLEDPEGDLEQGRLHIRVTAQGGGLELEAEAPILGFEAARTRGEVIVGFTLSGAAPFDAYDVELVAEDEAGRRSEAAAVVVDFSR